MSQTKLVILGESPSPGRYAGTYLFGAVVAVAVAGLGAGLLARPARRS